MLSMGTLNILAISPSNSVRNTISFVGLKLLPNGQISDDDLLHY
jgi:hypothetical protein